MVDCYVVIIVSLHFSVSIEVVTHSLMIAGRTVSYPNHRLSRRRRRLILSSICSRTSEASSSSLKRRRR